MNNLLCIKSPSDNPYFNIAAEEYLLKNFDSDIFLLYVNKPSIIIGKHQNALAEANIRYIEQNKIPLIRRLSGGGTVYHDLGNLNFAWIVQAEKNKPVNFNKYMNDIYLFLKSLNLNVVQTKNNDLQIAGGKISGNAEHIFKNRLIHHGTLLYNSNLEDLNNAIAGNFKYYSTKAVQSKRAKVSNIIRFMDKSASINAFRSALFHFIKSNHAESVEYQFDNKDLTGIERLALSKYSTWEWNFAYSPKYIFEKNKSLPIGKLSIRFNVHKGIISDLTIQSEFLNKEELHVFEKRINGAKHYRQELNKIFEELVFESFKQKTGLQNSDDLFF
ncbi:MAG: lipoate--protein ligase [Bacteroidales bacterium]|nr:lipoate--protein ligase [Bacteroidales bacterium]